MPNFGRCAGYLATTSKSCCDKSASSLTISNSGERTLFRFVPLFGSDNLFRIIVQDRKGGCNRFVSASKACSTMRVSLSKGDYGVRQRWIMNEAFPAPFISSATSSGFQTIVFFEPTPNAISCTVSLSPAGATKTVIPPTYPLSSVKFVDLELSTRYTALATCITPHGYLAASNEVSFTTENAVPVIASANATGFTSGEIIVFPPENSILCTVTLSPGNHKEVRSPTTFDSETFTFRSLNPDKNYTATAVCTSGSGAQSDRAQASFKTPSIDYSYPAPSSGVCDGFGEIEVNRKCVCDTSKNFVSRVSGGCQCADAHVLSDGECIFCECLDDPSLEGIGVCNSQGQCVCPPGTPSAGQRLLPVKSGNYECDTFHDVSVIGVEFRKVTVSPGQLFTLYFDAFSTPDRFMLRKSPCGETLFDSGLRGRVESGCTASDGIPGSAPCCISNDPNDGCNPGNSFDCPDGPGYGSSPSFSVLDQDYVYVLAFGGCGGTSFAWQLACDSGPDPPLIE